MKNKVFVVALGIGKAGGADRVTELLADRYHALGYNVVVFATACDASRNLSFKCFGPYINKGHRFLLATNKFDIAHLLSSLFQRPLFVHSIGMTYEICLLLKYLSWLKIIVWETTSLPNNKFIDVKIHRYLHLAKMVLAPSQTIASNFKKTFNYDDTVHILPFWVEWREPIIRTPIRRKTLLFIGRLDLDKGLKILIDSVKAIVDIEGVNLVICGKGSYESIDKLIDGNKRIKLTGWVSDAQLENYIEEADFIVLPSLHEGYPLSLIEACSRSKPVIASRVGSIPEVFEGAHVPCSSIRGDQNSLMGSIRVAYNESDSIYIDRCKQARILFEEVNSFEIINRKLRAISDLVVE